MYIIWTDYYILFRLHSNKPYHFFGLFSEGYPPVCSNSPNEIDKLTIVTMISLSPWKLYTHQHKSTLKQAAEGSIAVPHKNQMCIATSLSETTKVTAHLRAE